MISVCVTLKCFLITTHVINLLSEAHLIIVIVNCGWMLQRVFILLLLFSGVHSADTHKQ